MDPIADMLTRIRNASAVGRESLSMPYSDLKNAIAELLMRDGWIGAVAKTGKKTKRRLEITLQYKEGQPVISGIRRISTQAKRMYIGWKQLHPVRQGYGMMALSTPKGLLTNVEARKMKVGGEMLLEIW